MMSKTFFFAAALFIAATSASAQTYLEPSHSTLDRYHSRLRTVLREGFDGDVKGRVVVVPSFRPERFIGLRQRGKAWEIFGVKPQDQIWQFEIIDMMKNDQIQTLGPDGRSRDQSEEIRQLEAQLPLSPTEVGLSHCSAAVNDKTASAILRVWLHMLSETREPDEIGLDGITYYFSMPADGRELSAQAWTPRSGSRVGQFVELSEAMEGYCETRDRKHLGRMAALTKKLLDGE